MRLLLLLIVVLGLAACSASRESRAVAACEKAIAARITDKPFRLDPGDMTANTSAEGEDVIRVQSTIVFDPGMPREEVQRFDCRARFAPDRSDPDVIALMFVW